MSVLGMNARSPDQPPFCKYREAFANWYDEDEVIRWHSGCSELRAGSNISDIEKH